VFLANYYLLTLHQHRRRLAAQYAADIKEITGVSRSLREEHHSRYNCSAVSTALTITRVVTLSLLLLQLCVTTLETVEVMTQLILSLHSFHTGASFRQMPQPATSRRRTVFKEQAKDRADDNDDHRCRALYAIRAFCCSPILHFCRGFLRYKELVPLAVNLLSNKAFWHWTNNAHNSSNHHHHGHH